MKTWEKALAEVLERVAPLPAQRVALADARGRFLQEVATATDDAPAFDLSMMDGYAVGPEAAAGVELRVVGATRAGEPRAQGIRSGEARRIFTGAPLPGGAVRVVPQEEVECLQEARILLRTIPDSLFVRPRGSEAQAGEVILREGQRLGPAELAILAGLGLSEPAVGARPKVAHLVLGSELVDPADSPGPGQIRDTNSILIRSLIEENGAGLTFQRRLADEPQAIRSAIEEAHSDVLLVSGGASVGEHDHARSCLREAGFDFVFEGIRVRPGKPSAVGFRQNRVAICLPGNPVAHLAVFHLLVRPVLGKLAGAINPWPVFYDAPLLASLTGKSNPRHTFWPAVHGPDGLRPGRFLSSGDVLALAGVNAMISLEADAALPLVGTRVPFLPLHPAL